MTRQLSRLALRNQVPVSRGFAPGVIIDGQRVEPAGWMWLVSYALYGCEWAIMDCERKNWKGQARKWYAQRGRGQEGDQMIAGIEAKLAIRKELLCRRRTNTEPDA